MTGFMADVLGSPKAKVKIYPNINVQNVRQTMLITRVGNIHVFTVEFSECPGVGVHRAPPIKVQKGGGGRFLTNLPGWLGKLNRPLRREGSGEIHQQINQLGVVSLSQE
jgi:hypothetical protein